MIENKEILKDFQEINDEFTIFVIGQKYYLHRGSEYLKQFRDKENWISSNKAILSRIEKILLWIQKKIPNIADLVKNLYAQKQLTKKVEIFDVIVLLNKIFTPSIHRAAGPNIVDPIIIEEGKVSKKEITQYITLHKDCTYRPSIIVLLADDNFERAKKLFTNCPNGINIKFIENSGKSSFYKVINDGAKNIQDFIEYYGKQCFSTCSKTKQDVLLSNAWQEKDIIRSLTPIIFKIRSTFLVDHKTNAIEDINILSETLKSISVHTENERILKNFIECINNLFIVYCSDYGGDELHNAYQIAKNLDNDLLLAHVYRYSHFFNCSRIEKQELLSIAEGTFDKYNVADHAIYCKNNNLIHQFSMESIRLNEFKDLEGRAISDTPGLVLMAHIINNVGVAYLFEHFITDAIDEFNKGLDYTGHNHIQRLALKSNRLAALALGYNTITLVEAKEILDEIFTPTLGLHRMSFLTAQFALNVVAASLMSNPTIVNEIIESYPITELVQTAFNTNIMGTGSMIKQMEILSVKYSSFNILRNLQLPERRTSVSGIRLDFICQYGINPFFFNAWL